MTIDELIDWICIAFGDKSDEILDEMVHDCKSVEASNINNSSLAEQVTYLVDEFGLQVENIQTDLVKLLKSNAE